MNSSQIHQRADQIARAEGITHAEALARMGRKGNLSARRRAKIYGVLHPMRADRNAFANVELPANAWWRRDDL